MCDSRKSSSRYSCDETAPIKLSLYAALQYLLLSFFCFTAHITHPLSFLPHTCSHHSAASGQKHTKTHIHFSLHNLINHHHDSNTMNKSSLLLPHNDSRLKYTFSLSPHLSAPIVSAHARMPVTAPLLSPHCRQGWYIRISDPEQGTHVGAIVGTIPSTGESVITLMACHKPDAPRACQLDADGSGPDSCLWKEAESESPGCGEMKVTHVITKVRQGSFRGSFMPSHVRVSFSADVSNNSHEFPSFACMCAGRDSDIWRPFGD